MKLGREPKKVQLQSPHLSHLKLTAFSVAAGEAAANAASDRKNQQAAGNYIADHSDNAV